MRPILKHLLVGSLLCAMAVFTSGCLLRILIIGGGLTGGEGRVFSNSQGDIALCDEETLKEDGSTVVNCRYAIAGVDGEDPVMFITSTVELLSDFGFLGVMIDPVILQVPQAVTNFTGTYDDGGGAGPQPLVITTMNAFPVQPGVDVSAESGNKFIIVELPDSVAATLPTGGSQNGAPFNFAFAFDAPGFTSIDVKAMFTGKVVVNGQTFYAPLLPCVTDFASIPSVAIPTTTGDVDLLPAIVTLLEQLAQGGDNPGCNSQVYNFTPPTPLGPFMCYQSKASKGNLCADGAPLNVGADCDDEDDCGGTPEVTDFCVPNKFPKGLQATLTDQFASDLRFDVKKPVALCNPATAGAEVNLDEVTHLEGYQTKLARTDPPQPKPVAKDLRITNQLHPGGELVVDTIQPDRLLVPTAKSETGPVDAPDPGQHNVDHYNCHTVKVSKGNPKFPKGLQAQVVDQFNQPTLYDIKKPTRLCAPADKNGEEPGAEAHTDHLMCYQAKPARGQAKHQKVLGLFVNNQFGPSQVDTVKENELCLPSTKTLPAPAVGRNK